VRGIKFQRAKFLTGFALCFSVIFIYNFKSRGYWLIFRKLFLLSKEKKR